MTRLTEEEEEILELITDVVFLYSVKYNIDDSYYTATVALVEYLVGFDKLAKETIKKKKVEDVRKFLVENGDIFQVTKKDDSPALITGLIKYVEKHSSLLKKLEDKKIVEKLEKLDYQQRILNKEWFTSLSEKDQEKALFKFVINEIRDHIDEKVTLKNLKETVKRLRGGNDFTLSSKEIKNIVSEELTKSKEQIPPEPKKKAPPKKKKSEPRKKEPVEKVLPDYFEFHDLPKNEFYVTGKHLNMFSELLLNLGGEYRKKTLKGETMQDVTKMIFQGKILDENRRELEKLGGKYSTITKNKKKHTNKKKMIFEGARLTKNKERLAELGGRIPSKTVGSRKILDSTRIYFPKYKKSMVQMSLVDFVHPDERFGIYFNDWVERKIRMIDGTLVTLTEITKEEIIDEQMIEFVMNHIFGCGIEELDETTTLGSEFDEKIKLAVFENTTQSLYYDTINNARNLFTKYIITLSNLLIEQTKDGEFSERLKEVDSFVDKVTISYNSRGLKEEDVLIIFVLRYISFHLSNYTSKSIICKTIIDSAKIFFPSSVRSSLMSFVEPLEEEFETYLMGPETFLKKHDIDPTLYQNVDSILDDLNETYQEQFRAVDYQEFAIVLFCIILHYINKIGLSDKVFRKAKVIVMNSSCPTV